MEESLALTRESHPNSHPDHLLSLQERAAILARAATLERPATLERVATPTRDSGETDLTLTGDTSESSESEVSYTCMHM